MSEQELITFIKQQGYDVKEEKPGAYKEFKAFDIAKDGSHCIFFTLRRFGSPKELEESVNWVKCELEENFFPTQQAAMGNS